MPELVEERMHKDEQGPSIPTRAENAEQEGGHNVHALKGTCLCKTFHLQAKYSTG
jgi:hypothetical protein